MEYFIQWPFGSKGHYHFPSGISAVLIDFLARNKTIKKENFVLVQDSWNVQSKYTDYEAISNLTGLKKDEISSNYKNILNKSLPEIINIGKSIADKNIEKSKRLKDRLGLLRGGIYSKGKFEKDISFRDDSSESWKIAQERFLQLYKDKLIYWNEDFENPEFYLNIKKMMSHVPLDKLVDSIDLPNFAYKQFKNAYKVYLKDMPLSTIGAYATPVPLKISKKGIEVPEIEDLPIEPRYRGKEIIGPSVVLKPLFNCYFISDIILNKVQISPSTITFCNDQSLITRFNFPQTILTAYFNRNYFQKNLFNDLLTDKNGKRFSFKENVLLSLEEITEESSSLGRFLIARNSHFVGNKVQFEDNKTAYKKLEIAVDQIRTKKFSQDDKRLIFSKMFKKDITDFDNLYETLVESADIGRVLNFLTDYVIQASKINGEILPYSVKRSIDLLETILPPI